MVIKQDQKYHDFVDKRQWWGCVPNGSDVVSNGLFFVFGLLGLWCLLGNGEKVGELYYSWLVFYVGAIMVAFGSAFYHWKPSDSRLIWDRLPMTLMFMSFFVIVLHDDGGEWVGQILKGEVNQWLCGFLLIGAASVAWWKMTGDLTYYALVQFLPILIVVGMYWWKGWNGHAAYMAALGLYVLAKVCEFLDWFIFALTKDFMSGHTLKHLLSGIGVGVLALRTCW